MRTSNKAGSASLRRFVFVRYLSGNEIGVMRLPCNEIAMSDGFEKQSLAPTVPKTAHANDLSLEMCILLVVKSLHSSRDCWTCSLSVCENAVNSGLA